KEKENRPPGLSGKQASSLLSFLYRRSMTAGQASAVFLDTRVPANQGSARAGLLCNADILGLGEESQCFFAAFAADAALLHAAEGNAQVAHQPAVYPDGASVDLFCDAMGAIQVLRPDA